MGYGSAGAKAYWLGPDLVSTIESRSSSQVQIKCSCAWQFASSSDTSLGERHPTTQGFWSTAVQQDNAGPFPVLDGPAD